MGSYFPLLQAIGVNEFPDFLRDERVRALQLQLSAHEADLAETSSRYGPEWPTVKALNRKIEILEQQLD
ncbi:MAG: hypothetical protein IH801_02285, partial [Nitrospinae bacterium]|nr:hypothetical protein [Nitrospinota bacterium]